MKSKDLIALFLSDAPKRAQGGASGSTLSSIWIQDDGGDDNNTKTLLDSQGRFRQGGGGWSLWSYETCIARRWRYPLATARFAPLSGLIWKSSLRYTATTTRMQGQLDVALARLEYGFHLTDTLRCSFSSHEVPDSLVSAQAHFDAIAAGQLRVQTGYACGFGPARGRNKVVTTYGEVFKP